MTTSVIYCATSERVQIQSPTPVDSVYPITSAIVAANPSTATATLVSSTVTNAASGLTITSGSVPAATAGNLLVAVLLFGVSNVATTTNPSGWALNSMGGGTTNKRIEVWSKRAVGGESGVLTWTKPSGSSPWACHIYEFSGSVAGGLSLGAAITNAVFGTTITPVGGSTFSAGAILAFAASGTISAITTSDAASTASVLRSDDTWTYGAVEIVRLWNNQSGNPSTTFSWTTGRQTVWAAINLVAATSFPTTTTIVGNIRAIGFDGMPGDTSDGATGGQDILEFNTSSIGGDAISSATLGLKDSGSSAVEPTNATLEAWAVTTPDIPTVRGANDNNWYRGTANYGSLTKCATFPAASVWESLPAVLHSLTSEAAFPAQIQTTGTTRLMLVTSDLRLGTARTTDERYAYYREAGSTSNDPRITIIHTPATVYSAGGIVSGEAFGGISGLVQAVRAGSISSGELFGTLRLSQNLGVGFVVSGETYGTLTIGSVLARIGGLPSSEVVTGILAITTTSTPPGRYGAVTLSLASGGTVTVSVDKAGNVSTSNVMTGRVEDSI